jgi:hypothetical protein
VRVYVGLDAITKKPLYLNETARTYGEADKALALLAQADQQRSPATSGALGRLLTRWLEVAKVELTTRRLRGGTSAAKCYPPSETCLSASSILRPWIASTRTCARTEAAAACWDRTHDGLAPMSAGERCQPRPDAPERAHKQDCARGLPLAPSTVRQIHAILHRALSQGILHWLLRQTLAVCRHTRVAEQRTCPVGRPMTRAA